MNSIELAKEKWGHLKNLVYVNLLPDIGDFDLITVANVFHYIERDKRRETFLQLRSLLKTDGIITVFEHNPVNPLTLHAVRNCPLDEDTDLLNVSQFIKLARDCGFDARLKKYIVFFPKFLRFLRRMESFLGFLPVGAIYAYFNQDS